MSANPGSIAGQMPLGVDSQARAQRDAARLATEQGAAKVGQAMQVGAGGILINNGGSLTIAGTGSLNVGSGALNSAGSISAGTSITAGTSINSATINVTGGGTVGGNLTVNGQIFIPNGFAAVSGYTVAYIDGTGRLSVGASAARFKQDFEPVLNEPLIEAILRMPLLRFRLVAAVEEMGEEAPVEIGLLADYLEQIGLSEFVYRDKEGDVLGIQYERLTVPLIATVQSLDARLKALEGQSQTGGVPEA